MSNNFESNSFAMQQEILKTKNNIKDRKELNKNDISFVNIYKINNFSNNDLDKIIINNTINVKFISLVSENVKIEIHNKSFSGSPVATENGDAYSLINVEAMHTKLLNFNYETIIKNNFYIFIFNEDNINNNFNKENAYIIDKIEKFELNGDKNPILSLRSFNSLKISKDTSLILYKNIKNNSLIKNIEFNLPTNILIHTITANGDLIDHNKIEYQNQNLILEEDDSQPNTYLIPFLVKIIDNKQFNLKFNFPWLSIEKSLIFQFATIFLDNQSTIYEYSKVEINKEPILSLPYYATFLFMLGMSKAINSSFSGLNADGTTHGISKEYNQNKEIKNLNDWLYSIYANSGSSITAIDYFYYGALNGLEYSTADGKDKYEISEDTNSGKILKSFILASSKFLNSSLIYDNGINDTSKFLNPFYLQIQESDNYSNIFAFKQGSPFQFNGLKVIESTNVPIEKNYYNFNSEYFTFSKIPNKPGEYLIEKQNFKISTNKISDKVVYQSLSDTLIEHDLGINNNKINLNKNNLSYLLFFNIKSQDNLQKLYSSRISKASPDRTGSYSGEYSSGIDSLPNPQSDLIPIVTKELNKKGIKFTSIDNIVINSIDEPTLDRWYCNQDLLNGYITKGQWFTPTEAVEDFLELPTDPNMVCEYNNPKTGIVSIDNTKISKKIYIYHYTATYTIPLNVDALDDGLSTYNFSTWNIFLNEITKGNFIDQNNKLTIKLDKSQQDKGFEINNLNNIQLNYLCDYQQKFSITLNYVDGTKFEIEDENLVLNNSLTKQTTNTNINF